MKTLGNSDIGKIRQSNEDAFRFGSFDDGVTWAVVCDGMGGAAGGQIASSIAADMVGKKIEKCYNRSMTESSIENMLLSAIHHEAFIQYKQFPGFAQPKTQLELNLSAAA